MSKICINKNEFRIFYTLNNKLHREEGPAQIFISGNKEWYKHGLLHREDGPAVESLYNHKEWWLEGEIFGINDDFTNESWKRFIKTLIFFKGIYG